MLHISSDVQRAWMTLVNCVPSTGVLGLVWGVPMGVLEAMRQPEGRSSSLQRTSAHCHLVARSASGSCAFLLKNGRACVYMTSSL
jgi:hypothetical protein